VTALPKPPHRGPKPKRAIARRGSPRTAGLKLWRKTEELCDDLFSLYVRVRDGNRCRLCRSTFAPQCAHLISRRYKQCRHLGENAWTLCGTCHPRYTHDPLGWDDLVGVRVGLAEWARRKAAAQITCKPDYSTMAIPLRLLLLREVKTNGDYGLGLQVEKIQARYDALIGGGRGLVR
jgi:5-methylcytosine-specific restriction endonuclease McrA